MLPKSREDALIALKWNPKVMARIVGNRPSDDPFWDFKPYPNRFSMREVLAHLGEWDPISLHRIETIAEHDRPELPPYDEVQMAIDHGYSTQNPLDNLKKWAEDRALLISRYSAIPGDLHEREGLRITHGWISIADYPALIALHDSYHISQAEEYTELWESK